MKAVKCKKGQGNEPEPMTLGPPMEKKQKGERKKKKKRKVEADADEPISKKKKAKGTPSATPSHSGPAKPDRSQLDSTSGLRHGRFLGRTQKVYSSGWNMTGSGDHPCPKAVQADLDTGSCG